MRPTAVHFLSSRIGLPFRVEIPLFNVLPIFVLTIEYTDNRAGPSNLGNVISQILLCKQITPDFNQEELCSITKDSQDMAKVMSDMQEYIPNQETYLGKLKVSH